MLSHKKIGRYEVVSALGEGAMGAVYKAIDPLIERTVAIKTIKLDLSKEELAEFEERFYREAKSAGRLNHSNIVTIYDVGEIDDIAYIAMEYLEGESLRDKLDSGVVLPLEMIVRIAVRIASALNYAHENNVVHRDIKPANIMITPSRDVKIMDFGIAQIPTGSRTQLGTVLGSPKYMAPEQVAGQPTDNRADIFALGVVLYEMLTGTTPFNGDNLSAIMYKILNEEPAPPSTINPRVPSVFDRIISRALAKRPEDRYQTAREFAQDLRNQEAAVSQAVPLPAVNEQQAKTVQSGKTPAGPQDATVFLPPQKARSVIAAGTAVGGPGASQAIAPAPRGVPKSRMVLLVVVSVLAMALLVLYSQGPQPKPDRMPVPLVPVSEKGTVPPKPADEPVIAPLAPAPAAPISKATNAPAAAAEAKATVLFAISPWGEVFVDGKSVGVSPPLSTLQLEAGKHRLEVRNQAFTPYRDTLNLKPGQSIKIKHKFR